jgi:hypothetical protein
MFLVIGALAARRTGHHEVLLFAENGQMAIHLPLTAARLGAFSTHTAHPEVVHEMERLLGGLLEFPLQIRNPFLYQMKAECIATLAREHTEILGRSVSCWKASRQAPAHCGECVPCLVRRIALEANGVRMSEYARDLLAEDVGGLPPGDTGRRNFMELAEFVNRFGQDVPDAALVDAYPDLINERIDLASAIAMYRRFAAEARTVLARYPSASRVLD